MKTNKSGQRYLSLNEQIMDEKYGDIVAVVAKDYSCEGCIFDKDRPKCLQYFCSDEMREDGQVVVFETVNK